MVVQFVKYIICGEDYMYDLINVFMVCFIYQCWKFDFWWKMFEDNEDENLLSVVECEKRCQCFVDIIGIDMVFVMFYLQDRNWNVEVRLLQNCFNQIWDKLNEFEICVVFM